MRYQIVDCVVGFILGMTVAQLARHRRMILPFLATLALVAAPDAAAAQQTTVYGADGKVVGRAATDSAGTTTYYDAGGRVTVRVPASPAPRPEDRSAVPPGRTSGAPHR